MRLPSKSVHHGRNAEHTAYRDDRYVKCGRCRSTINLDRHTRANYGSRAGQGISHTSSDTTYDMSSVGYDARIGYDGYEVDFTITGGCPFCGAYTYDKRDYYNG